MADYDETEEDGDADDYSADAPKPKSSKAWLQLIKDSEKAYRFYQEKADGIDKVYANLERLANDNRDRQFQMFWANIQVVGPSIYSRPPVPVVVPRFKDRKPVPRVASELLERSITVGFETDDIDSVLRSIRDDLTIVGRGVPWVRYEAKSKGSDVAERVAFEHVDRKDFAHDPARVWREVDWTAKRSCLTRKAMRKRFRKTSGDAYKNASYEVRKDDDNQAIDDGSQKCGVWELWCKSENTVVWITEGVEVVLDQDKPHLDLTGFFPCPRPAYATVQRKSLIPVPDMLFYKDQLEEINDLTARIAALSSAVKVRAFYPSGAGEIGDAIEAAIKSTSDNQVMIPVSNWAAFGNSGPKDMIVWLPIDMIVTTITQLVALRKQLIDDVYQITGLSDIMRGDTVASETLGAQQLKSQYGSLRIRDKQDELARIARDLTRMAGEIMAENFSQKTLLEMSQLDIQTDADIKKQSAPLIEQQKHILQEIEHAGSDPEVQAMAKQNPDQAQQVIQQAQQQGQEISQQLAKLSQIPTIEQVMKLLRDQNTRPFILDIETDSTIAPDENAQKQRATEYMTAFGGFLAQALPLVKEMPQVAPLAADAIRFVQSQFRVGRQMDQTVDEFVDQMRQMAAQPQQPNPQAEAGKAQQSMDMQAHQANMASKQQDTESAAQAHAADMASKQQDAALKNQMHQVEVQLKQQAAEIKAESERQSTALANSAKEAETRAKMAQDAQTHEQNLQLGALNIELLKAKIEQVRTGTVGKVADMHMKAQAADLASEQKQEQREEIPA